MNADSLYRWIGHFFRPQRMEWFLRELNVNPETTVLDVGGTSATWTALGHRCPRVTLLNICPETASTLPHVVADARSIPFPEKSFDIVYSNSLIEHVGDWKDQQRCAREMSRVGKRLWIQTPNRGFPVEPHLLYPLVHWLPRRSQQHLVRLAPRALFTSGVQSSREIWETTRLLGAKQVRELFPNCQLHRERLLGITKSFIVS